MKKLILFILLCATGIYCKTFGQYTNDVNLNTRVSVLSDDVTGVTGMAVTNTGKAYIAYLDGYFELKLQLMDVDGYKIFDTTGITLESYVTSWTSALTTDIITDAEENAILAFYNWTNGVVKLFAISPAGIILDSVSIGAGSNPQLEKLPSGDFVLAYSYGDSTTIKKLSYSAGSINIIYSKTINYFCQKMKPLPNGNIYVVSYDYTAYPGYADTYVNCINGSNGNLLWGNWTSCSSFQNSSLYTALLSCCTDVHNNLYVSNTYFVSLNRIAYAQCIDSMGNALWGPNGTPLINDGEFNYQQRVFSLFNNSTYELLCLINGQTINNGSSTNKICYQKLSPGGIAQLGVSGVEIVSAATDAALFGAGYCGDNVALSYISGITGYIYATKMDLNGNFLWSPSLLALNTTSNPKPWVNALLGEINSDQIIIAFNETRNGHSGVYAQKAGCNGLLPTSIDGFVDNPVTLITYPNPTNGRLTIHNPGIVNPEVYIYNMVGGVVLHKWFTGAKEEIDLCSLPKGIYVVKVVGTDRPLYSKIFKD